MMPERPDGIRDQGSHSRSLMRILLLMERDPFVVDLNNSDDMRAKLEVAIRLRDDAEREFRHWNDTAKFLESRIQTAPSATAKGSDEGKIASTREAMPETPADEPATVPAVRLTDLASEVVNRELRKIRALEVCEILRAEGHDVNPTGVANALYYAAHKAQPRKIKAAKGRGMYAPLAFREENFDPPLNGQVSQARPEEPYSAPEEGDRVQAPGGSNVGVLRGAGQPQPQQIGSA
jgi:hypothetical protein